MMLMSRFSFCLMMTILMQLDRPACAEWVALADQHQSHPLQTVYMDPDTLHQEGNMVGISVLIDWKAMQGGRTPTRFYSTTLSKLVDCAERRVRTLTVTDFYGHMGTGEVISSGSHASEGYWRAVESGTSNEGLWNAACGKQ
jgi:hypothetical protein